MNPKLKAALWAIGAGASSAAVHYIHTLVVGTPINWARLEEAAASGALIALSALFTTPPGTTSIPNPKNESLLVDDQHGDR